MGFSHELVIFVALTCSIFDTKPTSAKNQEESAFHVVLSLIYTYWDFIAFIVSNINN